MHDRRTPRASKFGGPPTKVYNTFDTVVGPSYTYICCHSAQCSLLSPSVNIIAQFPLYFRIMQWGWGTNIRRCLAEKHRSSLHLKPALDRTEVHLRFIYRNRTYLIHSKSHFATLQAHLLFAEVITAAHSVWYYFSAFPGLLFLTFCHCKRDNKKKDVGPHQYQLFTIHDFCVFNHSF